MPVSNLHIENFRGIGDATSLEIKPITIFVGPNSSGKSSSLHALACLSQTMKIVADERPLVLDDENADVHLGRFIEVIHSKSYQDQISLGFSIPNAEIISIEGDDTENKSSFNPKRTVSEITATYNFKCTKKTQEVSLESFKIDFDGTTVLAGKKQQSNNTYNVSLENGKKLSIPKEDLLNHGFLINESKLMMIATQSEEYPLFNIKISSIQQAIISELSRVLYLGPFRQPPARTYDNRGTTPSEVGPMGESTVTMLANESIRTRSRPHLKQIAEWLSHLGIAQAVDVSRVGASDLFTVSVTLEDGDKFPIADLGYGISQALPVLTQCSFAPERSTLLFEQPELHVHPLASKGLAKVFVDTVQDKDCRVCIETHSPELVKAFCNLVSQGLLNEGDISLYSVRRIDGKSQFNKIDIDSGGDTYDNWMKDLLFEY